MVNSLGLLIKLLGGLSILGGIAFMFISPDIERYQHEYHTNISIYLGIGMIIAGVLMLKFG